MLTECDDLFTTTKTSVYDDNNRWLFEDDLPEGVEVYFGVSDRNLDGTRRDASDLTRCPAWGDLIPWKSITAIVPADLVSDAERALMDQHGGMASGHKTLADGRVAIRSDYQCW